MKRFIRAPRKSCGNHIARITSNAAFSHSQGHSLRTSGGPQRPYGRKPLKADTIRASSRMLGTLTNEEYDHA
jgi:hypothetical protein